ncbi:hypothetical protein DTW90_01955 [Neorhizobium sp. P12A]|nr:hypothetical protein DTW90_01955 [Neorhizobium sp. P12A]
MPKVLFSLLAIHTSSITVLTLAGVYRQFSQFEEKVPSTSAVTSETSISRSFPMSADRNISVSGAQLL